MIQIAKFWGALVCLPMACFALDYEQSVELNTTLNALNGPLLTDASDALESTQTLIDNRVDAYWNALIFPSDATLVTLRYGWSVQTHLFTSEGTPLDASAASGANYRVDDLNSEIGSFVNDDMRLFQQLDQLSLTWFSGYGDFVLGRQPISFGLSTFYSPVDVIAPLDLLATDRSYRPGVDALRGIWPLGAVSEVEAGYVLGEDRVLFGRYKGQIRSADVELTALTINTDQSIAALGVKAAIGRYGIWQETALLADSEQTGTRITVGADTKVFEDWFVMAELHYNGLGAKQAYLDNAANQSFYQLGAVLPLAQWYASVQASYPVSPLVSVMAGSTINLNDGSALINGLMSANVSDSMDVNVSAAVPLYDERSFDEEFSVYPLSVTLEARWVF